jgi:hypothetical protein
MNAHYENTLNDSSEELSDPSNEAHVPKEATFKELHNPVDGISSSWCYLHCGCRNSPPIPA